MIQAVSLEVEVTLVSLGQEAVVARRSRDGLRCMANPARMHQSAIGVSNPYYATEPTQAALLSTLTNPLQSNETPLTRSDGVVQMNDIEIADISMENNPKRKV